MSNVFYIFIFTIGLLVGYFLKAYIYSMPEGKPKKYPIIELLTAVVYLILFYKYYFSVSFFAYACFMSILIVVFFIDMKHRIIPNKLVIVGTIGGLIVFVYNLFLPMEIYGDNRWWNPLVGAITGSGLLFAVALIGMIVYKTDEAMGIGDVKIFIPIGLFLGWRMCLIALVLSIFAGGLSGIFFIITGIKKKKDAIPFGPYIVIAVFVTIMWGWNILNWYLGSSIL